MTRSITVSYNPSDRWWQHMLESLWVTILEGGSNYWVDKIDYDKPEWADATHLKNGAHLAENFEVTIYHGADEFDSRIYSDTIKVKTFDVIYDGIRLLDDVRQVVIMNNGDWDANDADHIFQLGVFGEIRYG